MTAMQVNTYLDIVKIDLEKINWEWSGKVFVNGYFDETLTSFIAQKEVQVEGLTSLSQNEIMLQVSQKISG